MDDELRRDAIGHQRHPAAGALAHDALANELRHLSVQLAGRVPARLGIVGEDDLPGAVLRYSVVVGGRQDARRAERTAQRALPARSRVPSEFANVVGHSVRRETVGNGWAVGAAHRAQRVWHCTARHSKLLRRS